MNSNPKNSLRYLAMMAALPIATLMSTLAAAQSEPFVGQLMVTGANFCPRGWARADGQLIAIQTNTALFSLLGTTYGGNGQTTFALPDLRGRGPIHNGQGPGLTNYLQGQIGGTEQLTVGITNMPSHNHAVQATNEYADKGGPGGKFLGSDPELHAYHEGPANKIMNSAMITNTGGGQPIAKRSPYLTMMWCIALYGIYPPRD